MCVPLFPFLELGLSGFELTLMSMPLIRGKPSDAAERPRGRIRNTRLLLIVAAVTMSVYLLASSLVTTVLIPQRNEPDLDDVPAEVLAKLSVHPMSDVRDVLALALEPASSGVNVDGADSAAVTAAA